MTGAPALPEEVRRAVVRRAAAVLGDLPDAEVPPALRRVRAFAPARRASAGAALLLPALEQPVFRSRVAASWRADHPELARLVDDGPGEAAGEDGTEGDGDTAALVLEGLHLLRPEGWAARAGEAAERLRRARAAALALAAEHDAAASARAAADLAERLRAERDAARAEVAALTDEVATLRREARRLRSDADRARAAARTAQAGTAQAAQRLEEVEAGHAQTVRRLEARAQQAEDVAEGLRRSDRDGRTLADVRVRLLLDTLVDAATGLRRELALPPRDAAPTDLVTSAEAPAAAQVPARALAGDDPAPLDELLRMPHAHLVVDGYNVTKTGYGDLALVDQRRRLVDGLAALQSRTGAEVTCCFDGAAVERSGRTLERGVRVLFSPPGTTADEQVRRIVRAEPPGRVVVVVSSDGEVVRGVVGAGARAVPSAALLRLLSRG